MPPRRHAAACSLLLLLQACQGTPDEPPPPDSEPELVERHFSGSDTPTPPRKSVESAPGPWQHQRNPPETLAEVRPAAERCPPISWPASIDEPTRIRVLAQVADLSPDGGIRHIRAIQKLDRAGYPALFGIVERLRSIDYRDPMQAQFGFELNKLLEGITAGLNARYAPVVAGERIAPAKAEWNTRTVHAWATVLERWPDADAFENFIQQRRQDRQ